MLFELDDYYPLIKNCRDVKKINEYQNNPVQWNIKNQIGKKDFDISLDLFHNKIIPPYHRFEVEYSLENHPNIFVTYEYYFEHFAGLALDKKECFQYIYRYLKSIICIYLVDQKIDEFNYKFRHVPNFMKFIFKFHKFRTTQEFHHFEFIHKKYKDELERYLYEKLSPEQLNLRKKSWDLFWGDTPEEQRGMWIQM